MYSKEGILCIELFMIDINIHLLLRWIKGYLKIDMEISNGDVQSGISLACLSSTVGRWESSEY